MTVTTTTRLGITRWSAGGDAVSRTQMDTSHAQLELLTAMDMQDVFANRPAVAAANRGLFFYATDTGQMFRSTGTAWIEIQIGSTLAVAVRVDRDGAQSISHNLSTNINFTAESYDPFNFHDNVTNNDRLTVPAGLAGKYVASAQAFFAGNVTGSRSVGIDRDRGGVISNWGQQQQGPSANASEFAVPNCTAILDLAVGDIVRCSTLQTSGGALNVTGIRFNMARIGA